MIAEPIIACIRDKHSINMVAAFRDEVAQHMRVPYTLVCLSDHPERCDAVAFIDTGEMGLPGQWARLLLFEPSWRGHSRVIFFDLDIAIVGDITPLTAVPGEFATLMDQSVMVIGAGLAGFVWTSFASQQAALMRRHGARACITALYPRAPSLRAMLPRGFFTRGCVGVP